MTTTMHIPGGTMKGMIKMSWILCLAITGAGLLPATARAQQFIYTNNNNYDTGNTTTALQVAGAGLTVINTYSTGGASAGGGYFAETSVAGAHTASNTCLFVSNGGDSTISAFTVNTGTGVLTPVTGSPFSAGVSGDQQYGIGLTVGKNKALFAGNTGFESISYLGIQANCSLSAATVINTPGSPDGMKVTPNGKYLIAAYLGSVDAFKIDYSTQSLTETGPFAAEGAAAGVEIACDNATVYFGDATTNIEVEVFRLMSDGQMSEVNNFSSNDGVNSNNVLLSSDGKTLYVSSTMSNQITSLAAGSGGSLTYGSTLTLQGAPQYSLGLAAPKSGDNIFISEQNNPEGIGVVMTKGTSLQEKSGSPFPVEDNGFDPASLTAVPERVCPQ
jgi:WD40 repeat protein